MIIVSFPGQKLLNIIKSHLANTENIFLEHQKVFTSSYLFEVFFLCCSLKVSKVPDFIWKSLIHFDWFLHQMRDGFQFSSHVNVQFLCQHFWNCLQKCLFWTLLSKIRLPQFVGLLWGFVLFYYSKCSCATNSMQFLFLKNRTSQYSSV